MKNIFGLILVSLILVNCGGTSGGSGNKSGIVNNSRLTVGSLSDKSSDDLINMLSDTNLRANMPVGTRIDFESPVHELYSYIVTHVTDYSVQYRQDYANTISNRTWTQASEIPLYYIFDCQAETNCTISHAEVTFEDGHVVNAYYLELLSRDGRALSYSNVLLSLDLPLIANPLMIDDRPLTKAINGKKIKTYKIGKHSLGTLNVGNTSSDITMSRVLTINVN